MGRKRKYNTVADIEGAFRAPEGHESKPDRKWRARNRNAALNRLSKREEAALTAALESTDIEDGDDSVAVTEMVSEALASVDALATQSIAPDELNGAVSEETAEVSGAAASIWVQQEVPTDQVNSAADIWTDSAPVRVRRPRQRGNMSASQLAEVRRKDRERKAASRSQMTGRQRRVEQGDNSAARALQRLQLSEDERQAIQDRNTVARASQREDMSQEERQIIQERDTTARAVARSQMTGEELSLQREAQRFRNRSRKYKKGYGNHEEFNPSVIRGKGTLGRRHYFSRFRNNRAGDERQCVHCKAWKFPGETDKCRCRKGKVQLPPRQEAPEKLRRLFEKPDFMKTIRETGRGALCFFSIH